MCVYVLRRLSRVQLCDPMDRSLQGSSVCGILQARILEWGPPPGDLPDSGVEPKSLISPASTGGFVANVVWEDCVCMYLNHFALQQ